METSEVKGYHEPDAWQAVCDTTALPAATVFEALRDIIQHRAPHA